MGVAYGVTEIGRESGHGLDAIMAAPAVFAFGLVAFGFLAWASDDRCRFLWPGN